MRLRLIKNKTVEEFVIKHPSSRASFENWLDSLKVCDWNIPGDIIKNFGTADILGRGSNRVIFNIGGNSFRIICKYEFEAPRVRLYIKWIGTHAKYTQLCQQNRQYDINMY